jgi:hypothetical protein
VLLFFGLAVILLQRAPDLPCQDDLTEIDSRSKVLGLVAVGLALATLLPCPGASLSAGMDAMLF